MKKGRHRRYEEARKFRRDSAAQFEIEDYDFEAGDGFAGIVDSDKSDKSDNGHSDDEYSDDEYSGDDYEDLAKKYDPDIDLIEDAELADAETADAEPADDESDDTAD